MYISNNIIETIGNTPMIDISKISPNKVKIFAKLESSNPSGSIKDRVAKYLIESAEKKGLISHGSTIIEPTSGNTGIALAMISRIKGYKMKAVMPDNVSDERKSMLFSLGAEIIFSKGEEGTNGAIKLAEKISKEDAALMCSRDLKEKDAKLYWNTDKRLRLRSPHYLYEEQVKEYFSHNNAHNLIIYGNKGLVVKYDKSSRLAYLKNYKAVELEGGHHLHLEYPEAVADVIRDWLKLN